MGTLFFCQREFAIALPCRLLLIGPTMDDPQNPSRNRRNALKALSILGSAGLAGAPLVANVANAAPTAAPSSTRLRAHAHMRLRGATPNAPLVKPRVLKRGDVVGLIAPSGFMDDDALETKTKNLESLGFRVKHAKNIRAVRGNTGGSISERVDDIHDMFTDRDVSAIWPARGGSGASQLLPHLDYGLIRRNAKALIGFSDITALLIAITQLSRIVTFHGPVAFATVRDYSVTQFEAVLMNPRPETTIFMSADNEARGEKEPEFRLRTIHPGIATGRLMGGNLSVLSAMVGTPFEAQLKNAILFLEDVGESPYRIDRMLTQIRQSQNLHEIAGAMLGNFRQRRRDEDDKLGLEMALNDTFASLDVPAVTGFSIGHIPNQFTIPVGIRARLDTEARTLTLLESAVIDA
jgi:muramoyltetrapeptide carboxypeptidase